jgi:hypothetical protein
LIFSRAQYDKFDRGWGDAGEIAPLLRLGNDWLALRISNLLLLAALFVTGSRWAREIDANPLLTGFALAALGLALVGIAVALGC